MRIQGAEFLKAKKTDLELKKVLKNIMGLDYVVEISENLSTEEMEKQRVNSEKIEADIIKEKQVVYQNKEADQYDQEVSSACNSTISEEEFNSHEYVPDVSSYVPEETKEIQESCENEYIIGRATKAKEKIVKIKDIGANEARITIEARVLELNLRETKTGKGMLIFEVYDGTATIVCKSFAKDMEEGERVKSEIEKAVIIKISGKAGLDTFANDVTIMANSVVKTDTEIPEMPEEDNSNPIILRKRNKSRRRVG